MAGPWEKYQSSAQPETGPWAKYAAPPPSEAPADQPRSVSDQLSDATSEWWKQVNPVSAVQGLAEAARHPIDTASNLLNAQGALALKAKDALQQKNYPAAVRHGINYLIPVLGPQIDAAGDLADKGEGAKAAGMTAGIATNIALPEALKGVSLKAPVGALAERMYKSALKPSVASYSTSEVGNMVKSGLNNEIPVSAAGAQKLSGLITDLSDQVKSTIQSGSKAGATINKFKVASRLGDAAKKFTTQVNPEADLNAIAESGNEFLRNQPGQIPADAAQALKQGTYQQLKGKAYGELKSGSIEAQKALARGIKEELETQFPEIKGLNATQGQLINLDEALERAVRRIDNHQLLGLGTPMAAAAGGVLTGSGAGAAATGILKMVLDDPGVKSRLAIQLNKAKAGIPLPMAQAKVAGYINALGNATKDAAPSDDSGQ